MAKRTHVKGRVIDLNTGEEVDGDKSIPLETVSDQLNHFVSNVNAVMSKHTARLMLDAAKKMEPTLESSVAVLVLQLVGMWDQGFGIEVIDREEGDGAKKGDDNDEKFGYNFSDLCSRLNKFNDSNGDVSAN